VLTYKTVPQVLEIKPSHPFWDFTDHLFCLKHDVQGLPPVMSASASKEALASGNTLTPTHIPATASSYDPNHNSTFGSSFLHGHPSSPVLENVSVPEEVGFVADSPDIHNHAATASKHHSILEAQEKGQMEMHEEKASAIDTETPVVQKDVTKGVKESGEEGESDNEIVYPGGLQLGLLTFGLCVATFVVALGKWYSSL